MAEAVNILTKRSRSYEGKPVKSVETVGKRGQARGSIYDEPAKRFNEKHQKDFPTWTKLGLNHEEVEKILRGDRSEHFLRAGLGMIAQHHNEVIKNNRIKQLSPEKLLKIAVKHKIVSNNPNELDNKILTPLRQLKVISIAREPAVVRKKTEETRAKNYRTIIVIKPEFLVKLK